jgi:ABC-type iron transport system FetAB permease component
MHPLAWIAALLIIAWIVLRVALAVTSGLLHLLWVVALVMIAIWLFRKLKRRI